MMAGATGDTAPVAKRFDERWRETKGEPFEFEGQLVHQIYRRQIEPRTLIDVEIWNIWLDERHGSHAYESDHYEIVQAWWAWSGMLIEENSDAVLLRCSGSYDGPDFTDLRARITFRRG